MALRVVQKTDSSQNRITQKQKTKLKSETYERLLEFERIGNRAVRQAQEENHRLGLPNIYSRNGKIIYEMPNGEIIVKNNFQDDKNPKT